jgi:hypothetical protein
MNDTNATGISGIIESVGGADSFVWLVMFTLMALFVLVMAYLNRNAERD